MDLFQEPSGIENVLNHIDARHGIEPAVLVGEGIPTEIASLNQDSSGSSPLHGVLAQLDSVDLSHLRLNEEAQRAVPTTNIEQSLRRRDQIGASQQPVGDKLPFPSLPQPDLTVKGRYWSHGCRRSRFARKSNRASTVMRSRTLMAKLARRNISACPARTTSTRTMSCPCRSVRL